MSQASRSRNVPLPPYFPGVDSDSGRTPFVRRDEPRKSPELFVRSRRYFVIRKVFAVRRLGYRLSPRVGLDVASDRHSSVGIGSRSCEFGWHYYQG